MTGLVPSDKTIRPISETPPGTNDKNNAEKARFVTLIRLQAIAALKHNIKVVPNRDVLTIFT